jgi:hypothetical protein
MVIIIMYTITSIIQTSNHSSAHTIQLHIYMAHFSFASLASFPCSPCWFPLAPLCTPSTYLAPSSCDRNRPPPSQVACKLTLFAPPFTQLSHLLQIPRTPTTQRLTTTTSGIFRSCYAEQLHIIRPVQEFYTRAQSGRRRGIDSRQ